MTQFSRKEQRGVSCSRLTKLGHFLRELFCDDHTHTSLALSTFFYTVDVIISTRDNPTLAVVFNRHPLSDLYRSIENSRSKVMRKHFFSSSSLNGYLCYGVNNKKRLRQQEHLAVNIMTIN